LKLFAVASIAALLTACGGAGSQVIPTNSSAPQSTSGNELTTLSAFTAQVNATGEVVHIYPTRALFESYTARSVQGKETFGAPSGGATSSGNLLYHNGPIQKAPKLYVVFWGSAWNGSGDPSGVASRLKSFYGAIGGSKWLNSVTQYTQSDGSHVGNAGNIFVGSYVDTTSTPPRRPTQSQMAAEATKAAAHFGDYSASASYVVAMPHGVSPSGFGTQYCAYHSSTSAGGGTIAWTNLPYMPDAGASCGSGSVNSGGTLDGVTIVGGHEQGETETDPQPNTGWLDSGGSENGDKCAWTGLENNPNAGGYPTQPLWSNATASCVQSY
jgi:serine protease